MSDVRTLGQTQLSQNQATYVAGIRRALSRGLLVVVFGAGVSLNATTIEGTKPLQQLTWNGLLMNGLELLNSEGRFGKEDELSLESWRKVLQNPKSDCDTLASAATYTKSELVKHKKSPTWLSLAFKDLHKYVHKPGVLEELEGFHLEGAKLMTTNYDNLLDWFCRLKSIGPSDITGLQMFAAGDLEGIVHIHGFYQQPKDVVLDMALWNVYPRV